MDTGEKAMLALSDLMTYPTGAFQASVERASKALKSLSPGAAGELKTLAEEVSELDEGALQELYTRTFDINPVCCLEIGWHLFGECYDRGGFLVEMRELMRRHGVEETPELPDHLANVVALLARMPHGEADRLAGIRAAPAVRKMLSGFDGKETPLRRLVAATLALLEDRFPSVRELEERHV